MESIQFAVDAVAAIKLHPSVEYSVVVAPRAVGLLVVSIIGRKRSLPLLSPKARRTVWRDGALTGPGEVLGVGFKEIEVFLLQGLPYHAGYGSRAVAID